MWKWGWHTSGYMWILLMCLIKRLPVPFIGLGQGRRYAPPLFFSHSYMRSMVAGRLDSLLLPTLLVICLCSIIRKMVLNGNPCIPWLWLIYPCSMGKPQDLTGTPYVRYICLGYTFSSKILKGLPRSPG